MKYPGWEKHGRFDARTVEIAGLEWDQFAGTSPLGGKFLGHIISPNG
jgi:hypothetical protein